VKLRPLRICGVLLVAGVIGFGALVGCGQKKDAAPVAGGPDTTGMSDTTSEAGLDQKALGDKIYAERCALCHGPGGKGDGPASAGLDPKPRNHTDGAYMRTRTNQQLLDVIRNGKGAMPAWNGILTEAEIHAVLKHVRSLAQ
jgi:mono/diheme cytochrome c family protein